MGCNTPLPTRRSQRAQKAGKKRRETCLTPLSGGRTPNWSHSGTKSLISCPPFCTPCWQIGCWWCAGTPTGRWLGTRALGGVGIGDSIGAGVGISISAGTGTGIDAGVGAGGGVTVSIALRPFGGRRASTSFRSGSRGRGRSILRAAISSIFTRSLALRASSGLAHGLFSSLCLLC